MQVQVDELRPYLHSFDFQNLLVEGLGWDYFRADPVRIHVDGHDFELQPAAEKAGFVVYVCGPRNDGSIPSYPERRKIERQVAKLAFEHIIIFVDAHRTLQVWQWVKREAGKPAACREVEYRTGQAGTRLLQLLPNIAFGLDEEDGLIIPKVVWRVRQTLDVEKVTKRFYDRFKTELEAFQKFIAGITSQGDREWYASLMLNRMMFVYFVQKQGFLDGDTDYLRNKLRLVQNSRGTGKFQQFYQDFLRRLFHEGLGQPESERDPEFAELLGRVPFLNGGLFDVHDLERDNPNISIPDASFERIFDFFEGYRWHLDERPREDDNEINPDVLGYIFEKYVNQKQMGAYYTKEDITGYITRNTVIPFLFDAAKKECPVAFVPGGGVWRLLQDDPDRYIYPAVGHGIAWAYSPDADPVRLEEAPVLPESIAVGLDDVSQRADWNKPAPQEYGLPTETWREVMARRRRYQEVRDKLSAGEFSDVNELVTLNLDIEQFAQDVIVRSEGPELLRAFWHALRDVSVLDPTCGSGAFLFAVLNILEPLYTASLEGMRDFLEDLEVSNRPRHPQTMGDFREITDQADRHHSQRYFILKSIVLNNLYGVDIMEEAVEICKLRLFLKLVAQLESYDQIEPLPDIDFNIRPGNTLVGFTSLAEVERAMTLSARVEPVRLPGQRRPVAGQQFRALDEEQQKDLERIKEESESASRAFNLFREQQTTLGGEIAPEHKADLRSRLDSLRGELDLYLATEYGVTEKTPKAYDRWQASHQPFHWFVEFYGIMSKGGFDVVVGNPPFVEYKKVSDVYQVRNLEALSCGNLYAFVTERSTALIKQSGRFGFITPISLTAAQRMAVLQDHLFRNNAVLWLSNFALRPAALFPGVMQRNTICITQKGEGGIAYTTDYVTWYSEERPALFNKLSYMEIQGLRQSYSLPKVNVQAGQTSLLKALSKTSPWASHRQFKGNDLIYYHNAGGYWIKTFTFRPYYRSLTNPNKAHTTISELRMPSAELATLYCALLNSNLFYFFWKSLTDARHIYPSDIAMFPVGLDDVALLVKRLSPLVNNLMDQLQRSSERIIYGQAEVDQYYVSPCKPIIDEIDRVLAEHYGFNEEELDFIINYDIKYRMGREG